MSERTHPCCDDCWARQSIARGHFKLVGTATYVPAPIALAEPELERCCWCGALTRSGIYVRAEPSEPAHHMSHEQA